MKTEFIRQADELDVLPVLVPIIWNSSAWIPPQSFIGEALGLLIGYKPTPSLMMVLVYGAYWAVIFGLYYVPGWRARAAASTLKDQRSAS